MDCGLDLNGVDVNDIIYYPFLYPFITSVLFRCLFNVNQGSFSYVSSALKMCSSSALYT